jgi:hypothetical protein
MTLCTPARDAAPAVRSALPIAVRVALAWRTAAKILGLKPTPGINASWRAADALLSATCSGGAGARTAGGAPLVAGARAAAACCLPLWCFVQHAQCPEAAAADTRQPRFSPLAGQHAAAAAAVAGLVAAAGHLPRGCPPGTEEDATLEAVGNCLGAAGSVFQIESFAEAAEWLGVSLDAAKGDSSLLTRAAVSDSPCALPGPSLPSAAGSAAAASAAAAGTAGPSLQQLGSLLDPLLQHPSARVAAAGLWALARCLRAAGGNSSGSSGGGESSSAAPHGAAERLSRVVVDRLQSPEVRVREAALAALPALLSLRPDAGAAGADGPAAAAVAAAGDAAADGDDPADLRAPAHTAAALVVAALSDARARAAALAAPTQDATAAATEAAAAAAVQAQRVALLRGAVALGAAMAGRSQEAPLLVATVDHTADDDAQIAAAAAELLQHRAALAGQPLQVRLSGLVGPCCWAAPVSSPPSSNNLDHLNHVRYSIQPPNRPQELLLQGPCSAALLRHVGLTLGSRPSLLGDLALLVRGGLGVMEGHERRLQESMGCAGINTPDTVHLYTRMYAHTTQMQLRIPEQTLASCAVPHVMGPICRRRDREALEVSRGGAVAGAPLLRG